MPTPVPGQERRSASCSAASAVGQVRPALTAAVVRRSRLRAVPEADPLLADVPAEQRRPAVDTAGKSTRPRSDVLHLDALAGDLSIVSPSSSTAAPACRAAARRRASPARRRSTRWRSRSAASGCAAASSPLAISTIRPASSRIEPSSSASASSSVKRRSSASVGLAGDLAPQRLEPVEAACLGSKHVHDDVQEVEQDPVPAPLAVGRPGRARPRASAARATPGRSSASAAGSAPSRSRNNRCSSPRRACRGSRCRSPASRRRSTRSGVRAGVNYSDDRAPG